MGKIKTATRPKYLGRTRNKNLPRSKVPKEDSVDYAAVSTVDPKPSTVWPSSCDALSANKTKPSFFGIYLDSKKSGYVHLLIINLTATFSSRKMCCNAFLTKCCAIRVKVESRVERSCKVSFLWHCHT